MFPQPAINLVATLAPQPTKSDNWSRNKVASLQFWLLKRHHIVTVKNQIKMRPSLAVWQFDGAADNGSGN